MHSTQHPFSMYNQTNLRRGWLVVAGLPELPAVASLWQAAARSRTRQARLGGTGRRLLQPDDEEVSVQTMVGVAFIKHRHRGVIRTQHSMHDGQSCCCQQHSWPHPCMYGWDAHALPTVQHLDCRLLVRSSSTPLLAMMETFPFLLRKPMCLRMTMSLRSAST